MPVAIATFYRFAPLPDAGGLRPRVHRVCAEAGIKGTVLLAAEGLNGTLAGEAAALAAAMEAIRVLSGIEDLPMRMSVADTQPFLRLKVRCKAEIVTMGDPTVDPCGGTGIRVAPQDWNVLLDDPDVLLIDTRNGFEVAAGSFPDALDPRTRSFSDFPAFVRENLAGERRRKIAMFCTGGIRCEKASSFMLREGFTEVYQLHGGVLAYLEQVPEAESRWRGDCFVFDGRVAVGHGLAPADLTQCFCCRSPLTAGDRASPAFEDGVSCPHCAPETSATRKAAARERHQQVRRAAGRGSRHIGPEAAGGSQAQGGSDVRRPKPTSGAGESRSITASKAAL